MGLFDALFQSKSVLGIARETIEFALESAEQTHPNEYMGRLRGMPAEELGLAEEGVVITDVLVMPGTTSSPVAASMKGWVIPNDVSTLGSVHSHPNGVLRPSDQDLRTFGSGDVHIILGAPYGIDDWRAFDREGRRRDLPVLNVSPPDPTDFFDFSQADIDEELSRR